MGWLPYYSRNEFWLPEQELGSPELARPALAAVQTSEGICAIGDAESKELKLPRC